MSVSTDRRLGVNAGLAFKAPVECATTANITLSGLQVIDGVQTDEGTRVLVWQQTSALENGIYNASSGNWTRALDFDGEFDVTDGTFVFVTSGTAQQSWILYVSSANPNVPNENPIEFTQLHLIGTQTFVNNFITNLNSPLGVPFVTTPTTPDRTLVGKCLGITAGITIPADTFSPLGTEGDVFWVANMTAGNLTLTQGTNLTLHLAGTTTTGNRTLAPWGIAPLYFPSTRDCRANGHVT